jgi:hypothetical protein
MKSLSKADLARRDRYAEELRVLRDKIEDEFRALNEETFKPINTLIDTYNETLEEARGFIEDLSSIMSDYYDERSEKWQDGDAGQAYAEWKQAYADFDAEDMEQVALPDTTEEQATHPEDIEALPAEPEQ